MHAMSARLFACSRVDGGVLRKDGKAARDLLVTYFPDAVDAHAKLVDVWATLEAKAGHADEARELCWVPLLQTRGMRQDLQKRYAWWEVQWGTIAKLREYYRELLGRKRGRLPADGRREAALAWVRAEERFGGVREEMEARRAVHALAAAEGDEGQKDAVREEASRDGEKRKHSGGAETGGAAKRAKTGAGAGAEIGGKGDAAGGHEAAAAKQYDDRHTVFVKHLHASVTEADLRDLVEVCTMPGTHAWRCVVCVSVSGYAAPSWHFALLLCAVAAADFCVCACAVFCDLWPSDRRVSGACQF